MQHQNRSKKKKRFVKTFLFPDGKTTSEKQMLIA